MRTAFVPFYHLAVQEFFMDRQDTPEIHVALGEYDVTTRPLKVGTKVDLIGISNNLDLLQNGKMDMTDVIYPETLSIQALFDVNSRGEILYVEMPDVPDVKFAQDGDVWRVEIETEIAGLAASFNATFNPITGMLESSGSVWGFTIIGERGSVRDQ